MNVFHKISGERSMTDTSIMETTIEQHKFAYNYAKRYVKNKTVLEIGCGTGYGSNLLEKYVKNITAFDKDSNTIKIDIAKYRGKKINFLCSSIEDFYIKKHFDVVISFQVIEHIKNPELFIKKVFTFLKPHGLFIITTPNFKTQSYNENPYHVHEYTAAELKKFLVKYGFSPHIYGIKGNNKVRTYEKIRRKAVTKFLNVDFFKIRNILPLSIKQYCFDLATWLIRSILPQNLNNTVTVNDYSLVKETENAIDLMAICKKRSL